MRWSRFAVLIVVVTVLQASLSVHLRIKPDLLLILLVFFSIYCNSSVAIITSFTIGFAADIIPPAIIGTQMVSFGLLGTLLAYLHRVITIRNMPYQVLVIFIIGFLSGMFVNLLCSFKGEPSSTYAIIFWTSLYSGLVGPFFFLPIAWWMRIKTHRFRRY